MCIKWQLISEKKPYYTFRMSGSIPHKISKGERPQREEHDPQGILFDDELWSLIERCWDLPIKRPKIDEVVERMEAIVQHTNSIRS